MSRTDKDRPYRVRVRDEVDGYEIHHDHRSGVCRTPSVKDESTPAPKFWRHRVRCSKYERFEYRCTEDQPLFSCWTYSAWLGAVRECCGHTRSVFHEDWLCSCDNWPEREEPTCTYGFGPGRRNRYWDRGVPRWYRNANWYAPERTRERNELREAMKLANAGEMDDNFDFANPQHRHGAGWSYF